MVLKILGIGVVEYLKDSMNIFDSVIVALSLVELFIFGTGGGSAISAFRSVRIFRTFRVLRVTRLVRSLQYMKVIMQVISNSIEEFSYVFLLLIIEKIHQCLFSQLSYRLSHGFAVIPRHFGCAKT